MSEARDRLKAIVLTELPQSYARTRAIVQALLAHPADLLAVLLESLMCETCEGDGFDPWNDGNPAVDDYERASCPACNGSKLDPVKVQAVLRQFADAGVLTEEVTEYPGVGPLVARFVGPVVPLGAPEGREV